MKDMVNSRQENWSPEIKINRSKDNWSQNRHQK